jgi:hypothetical protein
MAIGLAAKGLANKAMEGVKSGVQNYLVPGVREAERQITPISTDASTNLMTGEKYTEENRPMNYSDFLTQEQRMQMHYKPLPSSMPQPITAPAVPAKWYAGYGRGGE